MACVSASPFDLQTVLILGADYFDGHLIPHTFKIHLKTHRWCFFEKGPGTQSIETFNSRSYESCLTLHLGIHSTDH